MRTGLRNFITPVPLGRVVFNHLKKSRNSREFRPAHPQSPEFATPGPKRRRVIANRSDGLTRFGVWAEDVWMQLRIWSEESSP